MVVDWLRKNDCNVSKAAREFEVDRKRVREWNQKYEVLKSNSVGSKAKRRKIGECGRNPLSTDLDLHVFRYLEEERAEGRVVTNNDLTRKALQIALGLGLTGFKASPGWLLRWKRRHSVGVRCGTNSSQMVPADYAELIQELRASVIRIRKAKDISPSYIINMDQTMCRFDMPSTRTNDVRGRRTIRIKTTKAEKKGFTVALAATASGQKLPAVIIFKERNGILGERIKKGLSIPSNVRVQASTNGWMTATEYHRWLVTVLKRDDHRRLLIVESYSPHRSEDNIKTANDRCNVDVLIIPGGCTSIVQPMDKCINKPFKESMRASWQAWMREERALTKAGNLKQPTRQDAINWVSEAWRSIKVETVVHSFLVCGLSNALDGSQDDLVSSDVPAVNADEIEPAEEEEDVEIEGDADDLDPFSEDEEEEDDS